MSQPLLENYTLTEQDFLPYEENSDPNRLTHIVSPAMNKHIGQKGMTAKEIVEIARMNSWFVTALCGYKWVPAHNPELFDTCDECLKTAAQWIREDGK